MSARLEKPNISSYIREHVQDITAKKEPGPYLTISRQWGCDGLELCERLIAKLNERDEEKRWRVYHRDILRQLAEDTGLTEEILEKERRSKPSLIKDFLRGLKREGVPDAFEIRNKIALLVRTAAFEGHAVILGQGGTAATGDLANGLSVRVVAPRDWRIARICIREDLDKQAAEARIDEVEEGRELLRAFYERQNPRDPAFNLVFDNSMFSSEQICELTLLAMEQKNLVKKADEKGKIA